MILKDKIDFQGHFSVKIFKKDGSIETYEDKNLIMDEARSNMAELVGGYTIGSPIDKFVLGNKGHNETDILDYKKVGANNEFLSDRTKLFSEDPLYSTAGGKDSFTYQISFDVTGSNSLEVDEEAAGWAADYSAPTFPPTNILPIVHTCEVSRSVVDRTCTYVITIPDIAGNKVGEGEVVAYTEAALYAGSDIFSMKTFPARVKEDTVKFEITWSIIF